MGMEGGGGLLRPKVADVAKYSCMRFWVFNAQICILTHSRDTFSLIFTTRKRSLGQGNVFIGVCLPTRGVVFPACIIGHMTNMTGVGG